MLINTLFVLLQKRLITRSYVAYTDLFMRIDYKDYFTILCNLHIQLNLNELQLI